MVFHCYELSDDSNAAFTFFVYIQKAFEIGNCYFPEQSEEWRHLCYYVSNIMTLILLYF